MTVEIQRIHEYYITATTGGIKFSKPMEEMSNEERNVCLTCFHTSARKKDGTYYKSSSMKCIRTAIDRLPRSSPQNKQMDEKSNIRG